jgi:hypothetical protein
MAILAIHTDCFKLLILAISCKNLGDEYPDPTGSLISPDPRLKEERWPFKPGYACTHASPAICHAFSTSG